MLYVRLGLVFNDSIHGLVFLFCHQDWIESLTLDQSKTQWRHGTNPLIMVNADIALRYPFSAAMPISGAPAQFCTPGDSATAYGCINPPGIPQNVPSTAQLCLTYANSNGVFVRAFALAFARMSAAGYGGVVGTADGATTTGKLGTLTTIDLSLCPV